MGEAGEGVAMVVAGGRESEGGLGVDFLAILHQLRRVCYARVNHCPRAVQPLDLLWVVEEREREVEGE